MAGALMVPNKRLQRTVRRTKRNDLVIDYDKYTSGNFAALGLNTPESEKLAADLAAEVLGALHQAILPTFERIVDEFNARGHAMTLWNASEQGEVAYRHEIGDGENGLRLAFDIVISSGYSHLSRGGETVDEIVEGIRSSLEQHRRENGAD